MRKQPKSNYDYTAEKDGPRVATVTDAMLRALDLPVHDDVIWTIARGHARQFIADLDKASETTAKPQVDP